jgi:hypothetical protein
LAHAGRKIVDCVADLLSWPRERVCTEAGIPLLAANSVKKALDYTWSDRADKAEEVSVLVSPLTSLEGLGRRATERCSSKTEFKINVRDRTITCPVNKTQPFEFDTTVEFDPEDCDRCQLRDQCTDASLGHGRTVSIADNEQLQKRLRRLAHTRAGRARPRASNCRARVRSRWAASRPPRSLSRRTQQSP